MHCLETKDEEEMLVKEMLVDQAALEEDVFEEPRVLPRVGTEYQVEIPDLATEEERTRLKSKLVYNGFAASSIPNVWKESSSVAVKELKDEPLGDQYSSQEVLKNSALPNGAAGEYSPVLYTPPPSWNESEEQTFLLGLYIFDKNLSQVRKFVESKSLGDVLSHYYGKFYRSSGYQRWAECRKTKSRKCILGARIFMGPRQQELLSRLQSVVSQESHSVLLEVFREFNEGRSSFEDFIFTLKSKIEMQVLVDTIGIGKGKSDLTGMVDVGRPNQSSSVRSEIPNGKACSSLTSEDIIKILTGDYRISKAKSNDLFWEAVWPRLLARGWHSEQPRDLVQSGSKNSLVFLLPGVKKFSRKKLVKGDHYFDSVSDVLSKVASDPRLLELDGEGAGDQVGTENEVELFPENSKKLHCYLQTRIPECIPSLMKFTVVDTSLVYAEEPFKVRALRSLPASVAVALESSDRSGDQGNDSSEEKSESDKGSLKKADAAEAKDNDQKRRRSRLAKKKAPQPEVSIVADIPSTSMPENGLASADQGFGNYCKMISFASGVIDSDEPENLGENMFVHPVSKRRRLATCNTEKRRPKLAVYRNPHLKDDVAAKIECNSSPTCEVSAVGFSTSTGLEFSFPEVTQFDPLMNNRSYSYSYVNSYDFGGYSHGQQSYPIIQTSEMINQEARVQVPVEQEAFRLVDSDQKFSLESTQNEPGEAVRTSCHPSRPVTHQDQSDPDAQHYSASGNVDVNSFGREQSEPLDVPKQTDKEPSEQETSGNVRRQSVRNRPPTTRALEALAYGFLDPKRKGRSSSVLSSSRVSRRPRQPSRSADCVPPLPLAETGGSPSLLASEPSFVISSRHFEERFSQ